MLWRVLLLSCTLVLVTVVQGASHYSLGAGTTTENAANLLRFSASHEWRGKIGFRPNWQFTPYWEASLGVWKPEGNLEGDGLASLTLRLVIQKALTEEGRLFYELGTGPMYISQKQVVDKLDWGSNLQFDSHVGLGAFLGKERRLFLMYRFQHASNGGFHNPNPGINFQTVQIGIRR